MLSEKIKNALFTAGTGGPLETGVSRIMFDVDAGQLTWRVVAGGKTVLTVPVVAAELPAVLEATELLLSAEIELAPSAAQAGLDTPAATKAGEH